MYKHFTIPNFLSEEECNSLLVKCKEELVLKNATVRGGELDFKSRKSSVAFIDDLGFLNKRLQNILIDSVKVNGFSVSGLQPFQFTEYNIGEHYDWHRDSSINNPKFSNRFYSTVIQLNDEYTDGELQLNIDDNEITLERGLGTLYMFPSHTLHRVKPITSGVRYSLVNWIKLVENKNEKKSLL
jgi:predicted 2-oxoglutarate/Fe(II)-dependent dioxygenase YbiX